MAGPDTTKALRIAKVIELLNKKSPYGGVSLTELADSCEVTTRSILRYLDQIENDLHVSIVRPEKNTSKKEGLYRLDAGYLPSVSPENALIILLSMLQQQGSALAGRLNEIKDALIGTLFKYKYSPQSLPIEQMQERIYVVEEHLADPAGVGEIFANLVQAIKDCYRVKLWYYVAHSGENSKRVVEPYGLICKHHNWYLVAHCLKRNDIRVFRVDQVSNVIPYTSEHFEYPKDFSLKDHMAHSWGVINDGDVCKVKLKFSPQVARRVKNLVYHPSQVIQDELPDGSVVMSFEICGIDEMKTWLVQWGDMVEVLEPEWLREDMCEIAKRILEVYNN
ncbi:WYL domain-containing protein [Pelotomaculum isophthalicicum JI]|uniref:WYL domain-containing protein n=1 Tax=Pelotomaculum isophthalicicum JI TaxID=947010 RepID=A0A9X4H1K7_9FIRM|nr:WYL domain-containing protein [Pelotomaculum isophthalicicum]MDF9408226.1 WYL domain-containing protein [Pelotomaculum isophthalicicum JI]